MPLRTQTPSLVPPALMGKILTTLQQHLAIDPQAEVGGSARPLVLPWTTLQSALPPFMAFVHNEPPLPIIKRHMCWALAAGQGDGCAPHTSALATALLCARRSPWRLTPAPLTGTGCGNTWTWA